MAIGKKKARELLSIAKEARRSSTMENASFSFPDAKISITGTFEKNETIHPDDYIKEKTRIYRASWLTGPLDEIIAELEKHI